jgi:hypothetical protein
MYTKLPTPFKDWTVDDDGTIHTASGYKCSPELIEAALWLFEAGKHLTGSKRMFSADDTIVRPLYEIRDITIPKQKDIHVQRRAGLQATTAPTPSPERFSTRS